MTEMPTLLMYPPGQIQNRRIQQRSEDIDYIAGGKDGQKRPRVISAVEREQCKEQRVQQLADQRGSIVAQPKEPASVAGLFLREGPPFVVEPHIEHLADGINCERGNQHPGGAGEDFPDGPHGPVALGGYVQEPALAQQQEEKGSEHTDPHGPVRLLFPFTFGEDVRDKKGDGKKHISQCLLHAESMDEQQHLDVGQYRRDGGQTVEPRLSKKTIRKKRH